MAWDDTQTSSSDITYTEWNNMVTYIKSGITSTSALAGSSLTLGGVLITATGTEINYLSGVTSAIQTQLGNKADSSTLTSHTGTSTIHFTQGEISIPASQISDFDTEVSNNTDVAANTSARHNAVTIGTANGLSLATQALSLAAATSTVTGALTSTDWQTFNNKLSNVVEDTTPQLGGNLDLNGNALILVGQTVSSTVSTGNIAMFDGTSWIQADASVTSTCDSLLGISLGSSTIHLYGPYTTSGLTSGAIQYVSETAGATTETAPSTSTSIVRIIGYALSTTELFFDPDKTYIEVA